MRKIRHETRGRPTKMTPEIIRILEEAFIVGANDVEACFQAGITKTTLYEYCKDHPDFSDRKEALKEMPKYRAKKNIAKALDDGDKYYSAWYLDRKAKDEFSTRSEITGKDGEPIAYKDAKTMTPEEIDEYLKNTISGSKGKGV